MLRSLVHTIIAVCFFKPFKAILAVQAAGASEDT